MDEQTRSQGTNGTADSAAPGADQPSSGHLRERLAALGERLDQLVASPEAQDARQKVLRAVDDLEERLSNGELSARIEAGITELGNRVVDVVNSPRGQEVRGRLAVLLHDLANAMERGWRVPEAPARPTPPRSTASVEQRDEAESHPLD